MVKLARNKTSKLLRRGTSINSAAANSIAVVSPKKDQPDVKILREVPKEPHIVFMSEDSARSYNCEGSIVISIDSPGKNPDYKPSFPKAMGVLYLEFNPVFEENGWFQTQHRAAVMDFLSQHPKTDNIIVHCGQGQYRSRAVALGIFDAYTEEDPPYTNRIGVYRYTLGRWTDASISNHADYHRGCERTHFGVYRAVTRGLHEGSIPQHQGQRFLTLKAAASGTQDGFHQTTSVL